jgi:RNA polymerase sigma factor (sigma-70 family)
MATSPMNEVIQHLRRAGLLHDAAHLTDRHLLENFISRRDVAALEVLVRRHGPMVWDVCRRVLGNHHDAEDAFQATFLVLIRKAASIRTNAGNWLYGVAHQTALKARATRAKRRVREVQVTEMPERAEKEQTLWCDLQPLLDHELSLLPEKYRAVIVLCDLEGQTGREAARQLGCPEGTVASRLARARAMLAKRLTRHGLAVSGGTLAGVLSSKAVSASVPTPVMTATIKAVTLVAAGQAAAKGAISLKVAALTEGVMKSMLLTKLKIATVVLLAVAILGTGSVIYRMQAAPATDGQKENPQQPTDGDESEAKKHHQEEQIAWGPAAQLGIVLKPNKKVFKPGEVVQLQLILRNAGQQKLSLAIPNTEVCEKFGMDIFLQDQVGRNLSWEWGERHSSRPLTVSGARRYYLNSGESRSLGEVSILIGSNKRPEDVMAKLKVNFGQICRLKIKLKTYSSASDDHAEPLESGSAEFRVDGAKVPPEEGR